MRKDFTNNTSSNHHSNDKQQSGILSKKSSLFILLVTAALAFLIYCNHAYKSSVNDSNKGAKTHISLAAGAKHGKKHHRHEIHQPHYEFYTMLPNAEVAATLADPAHGATVVTQAKVKKLLTSPIKKLNPHHYMIQVASFHNYKDADPYKAKLLLSGDSPKIQKITINNKTSYRVIIGPYHSLASAEQNQERINHSMHTKSVLLVQQDTRRKRT